MKTMTTRQRRARQLADLVAQQEALAAEEAAEDRAVEEAMRHAGKARCGAVQELYEVLGIDEQTTERRAKDGTVKVVRSDRDETKRAALLVEAVVALVRAERGQPEPEEDLDDQAEDEGQEDLDDRHEHGFDAAGVAAYGG